MYRLVFALLTIAAAAVSLAAQTSLRPGDEAPSFRSESLDGKQVDLAAMRGSVVVLTFWTTRCEICRHEFPKLYQVVERNRGRNVVFLALTTDDVARIDAYTRNNRVGGTILPNSFGVLLRYADRTADGSLDMGYPAYFVIDKNGLVQWRSSGFDKTASLSAAIERLLVR